MLSLIVIGMRPPLASTCQVLSFQALPELPCIALLNMMMMIKWACIKTGLGIVVSSLLSPSYSFRPSNVNQAVPDSNLDLPGSGDP